MRGTGRGKENERGEKSRNVKQEERRRAQKRAPESVPFAFMQQPLRPLGVIYFPSAGFLLSTSFPSPACQSCFLFLAFPTPVFGTALHRAACSCRLCFIIPQLFRIHATPLQFLLCHPLSSRRLSHTKPPSLSRHYHAPFCKIYVCRRAGDVAAGYLFFQ